MPNENELYDKPESDEGEKQRQWEISNQQQRAILRKIKQQHLRQQTAQPTGKNRLVGKLGKAGTKIIAKAGKKAASKVIFQVLAWIGAFILANLGWIIPIVVAIIIIILIMVYACDIPGVQISAEALAQVKSEFGVLADICNIAQ